MNNGPHGDPFLGCLFWVQKWTLSCGNQAFFGFPSFCITTIFSSQIHCISVKFHWVILLQNNAFLDFITSVSGYLRFWHRPKWVNHQTWQGSVHPYSIDADLVPVISKAMEHCWWNLFFLLVEPTECLLVVFTQSLWRQSKYLSENRLLYPIFFDDPDHFPT